MFLYVVSHEVCHRVGGVHTVLQTSAPHLRATYGDDLLYVGPDLWADRARQDVFVEDAPPAGIAALAEERNVPVRFGRWNIDGAPPTALVDFGRLLENKNELLGDLWDHHRVDSIHADWDTVERLLFGVAAGILVELHFHAQVRPRGLRAAAHFHQWQAAAGLLHLADAAPDVGTVYTPHGTALGRALASAGVPELGDADPAAAAQASVLTDVSAHAADEAALLLGRRPDLVTPNGCPRADAAPGRRAEVRDELFRCASRFLGRALDAARTRVVLSSGRYEFHNKGLDLCLDAFGRLARADERPARDVLFLIAVAAPQTGPRPEVTRRLAADELAGAPCGVCTHNLAHPEDDPILAAARAHGLDNEGDGPVHFLFAPVTLDGRDPVWPYAYADVLGAADLTLFPSLYEPWGYTPVESLAAGVPTVTTDLTGFGRFLLDLPSEQHGAVAVVAGDGDTAGELADVLRRFLARDDGEVAALRERSGELLEQLSWDRLAVHTRTAHEQALAKAAARAAQPARTTPARLSRRTLVPLPAHGEERPRLHRFTVAPKVPATVARLDELARNLWWSWHPSARALFARLDPAEPNPVRLLRRLPPDRLEVAAKDPEFAAHYAAVLADLDDYRAAAAADVPATAYFCAEFALHESLPVYSGGLGVLAGDHLKSASDLRLPLTAVGLLYAHGYFVQRLRADGTQAAEFVRSDPRDLPLEEVLDGDGAPLRITIPLPERDLHAGAWRVHVGRVPLYLLDTAVPENDPADRGVTDRLYPSEREPRLRQEILLGMGGWRLLAALGAAPDVCHLNEGHSAFLLLERLLELVEERGLTFTEAREVVRAGSVFTTHTPVPAGHDRFSEGLMRRYFGPVAERLGLDWEEFLGLGRTSHEEHEFSMTVLALKLTGRANGVSELHGAVSREMLANVWPGLDAAETPVGHVTNGVHLATWVGPEMRAVLGGAFGPLWAREHPAGDEWARAGDVDDEALFAARGAQRRRMVRGVRASVRATATRRGEDPAALRTRLDGLVEDALWIGYARRFAPYKRATLLFRDPERLSALLDHPERPVRVVFAGKAHPDDAEGRELVRRVVDYAADPRFAGRIFFVEDYGMHVGRLLTQGVDVWLNTPMRPQEASGTSGMKACLNGGLHASILDGWWCEGFDGDNGWAFGGGADGEAPEIQKEHDARALYEMLESEIAPLYFDRDAAGVPRRWLQRVRRNLATVPGVFNTHRMVADYVRTAYRPAGALHAELEADDHRAAKERAARAERLRAHWDGVVIEDVSVTDLTQESIAAGEVFEVRARVRLGALSPDEVRVELYAGRTDAAGRIQDPVKIELRRTNGDDTGSLEYQAAYLPEGSGTFQYGIRVRPKDDAVPLVRWA